MLPDNTCAKTVHLLVKYVGGQWLMDDGAPLPEIRDGALGEWTLNAFDIVEDADRTRLTIEENVPLLNRDTRLWVQVDGKGIPPKLRGRILKKTAFPGNPIDCVSVVLQDDLKLVLRPNADAKLTDCRCTIPALNTEAKSLNHAYTLISAKFEPMRRSHGGNVFHHVFYEESEGYIRAIKDLRLRTELFYASSAARCVLESSIYEVWLQHMAAGGVRRAVGRTARRGGDFPFPKDFLANEALIAVEKDYHEAVVSLITQGKRVLVESMSDFHDPEKQLPDILRLRELHAAMDRAVLDAYGWTDLQPTCEFLLDYEVENPASADDCAAASEGRSRGRGRKKPWRYRWPDDLRDEVLARLLELNRHYAEAERLSGAAAEKKGRKKNTSTTKGAKNTKKEKKQQEEDELF